VSYAFDLLQSSESTPWSTVEPDINANGSPAAETNCLKDNRSQLELFKLSLQDAVSMVTVSVCVMVYH